MAQQVSTGAAQRARRSSTAETTSAQAEEPGSPCSSIGRLHRLAISTEAMNAVQAGHGPVSDTRREQLTSTSFVSKSLSTCPSRNGIQQAWSNWSDAQAVQCNGEPLAVTSVSTTQSFINALQSLQGRWRHQCKVTRQAIRRSPWILILPLLLAAALIAVGVAGVLVSAKSYADNAQQVALNFARAAGMGIAMQFDLMLTPCASLEACILQQPHFPTLNQSFPQIASQLLSRGNSSAYVQLQLMPFGRIVSSQPFNYGHKAIPGYDTLNASTALASDVSAMATAVKERHIVINFKPLPEGGFGAVAYYPVFVQGVDEDETFGNTFEPTPCESCVFYNATTREKWWGAVCAIVELDKVPARRDPRLRNLWNLGYDYQLLLPPAGGRVVDVEAGTASTDATTACAAQDAIIKSTDAFVTTPVSMRVPMPDGQYWVLCVAPQRPQGWQPSWKNGSLALVVVASLVAPSLLFALLLSHWQYRHLVWNMLPKHVVATLQAGRHYAEPYSQVTVLFADIISYTSMSSEMTPDELVGLLSRLYGHYDTMCATHGMFKVETIGDCFMAVAGCPERCSPEEAARRAASMALDMISFAETFVNTDGRRIRIRVGMHSGNVTAAVVGSQMYHMCLIGDTVNVASRMETHSQPMRCHVGETTACLLADCPEFSITARGQLDIKGKGFMSTYWLNKASSAPQAGAMSPAVLESAAEVSLMLKTTSNLTMNDKLLAADKHPARASEVDESPRTTGAAGSILSAAS